MFFAERRSRRKREKRDVFLVFIALSVVNHIGSHRSANALSDSVDRLGETLGALTAVIASREPGDEEDKRVVAFLEKYADTPPRQMSKRKVFATTVGYTLRDFSEDDLKVLETKILDLLRSDGAESVLFRQDRANSFTLGVVFAD